MLKSYDILFRKGDIITAQMLKQMYESPMGILELMFADRSDGIVSGMEIKMVGDNLVITKGIYKLENRLYIMPEDKEFSDDFKDGKTYIIKMVVKNDEKDYNILVHNIELVLQNKIQTEKPDNDKIYTICEFKGRPTLPTQISEVMGNSFNIRMCRYSHYKDYTFHPKIFEIIRKFLIKKKNKHPMDYFIINEIDNSGLISKRVMEDYISEAGGSEKEDLLEKFVDAMKRLKPNYAFKESAEKESKNTSKTEQHQIFIP